MVGIEESDELTVTRELPARATGAMIMSLREQGSGAQFGRENKVVHARCGLGTTRHLGEEKPSTGVGSFLVMERTDSS